MNKVLVFTGAGFCHPLKLPLTTGFGDLIPSGSKLQNVLHGHLGAKLGDVEYVLSILEQIADNKSIIKSLEEDFRIYHGNMFGAYYDEIVSVANKAIFEVKLNTFQVLKKFDEEEAAVLYSNFLDDVYDCFDECSVSFFTTNYDLTFENSIDSYKRDINIDYGFSPKGKSFKNTFDEKDTWQWKPDHLEFKKLHGSLDWNNEGRTCVRMVSAVTPDNPSRMPILYPGYKDVPTQDPFLTFHNQLMSRLFDADYVLAIGFAFRDPYINSLFNMEIKFNKNLKVLCFNPTKIENLPQESAIREFNKSNKFEYIEKGISLEKDSLGLRRKFKSLIALKNIIK